VVDRGVAVPSDELTCPAVPERRDRGRVGEADQAVRIDDPHRLGDGTQHRGQEVLRVDLEAGQVDEGVGHEPSAGDQFSLRPSIARRDRDDKRGGRRTAGACATGCCTRYVPQTMMAPR
jgi:hypothetical protein